MVQLPHLLLASKSPRRHILLRESGFDFSVVNIEADETFPPNLMKSEVCTFLAEKKAGYFGGTVGNSILVTADTIVCLGDEVINKPADKADAFAMLQKLSGTMHEVFTGVCMKSAYKTHVFYESSEVWFYELSEAEIWHYINNYHPFDKAGAYGVQDWMGYIGMQRINGCFYNVMGFPVARFYRELQHM